jgi:hypothetical protein
MGERNQRRDPRISTVASTSAAMMLPVSYQVLSATGEALDAEIRTGLALDVSASGMCIQIRHVPTALERNLSPEGCSGLRLSLDVVLPRRRLRLATRLAWVRPDRDAGGGAVRVGVEFDNVTDEQRDEVMSFARALARRPRIQRLIVTALALVALAAAAGVYWSQRVRDAERAAHEQQLAETRDRHSAAIGAAEDQYHAVANALDQQTAELNDLAVRMRHLGVPGKSGANSGPGGPAAIQTIRESLADVRERIMALEEQILPDGTCVETDRCGERKCCTWQGGICLCDDCCAK